MVLAAGDYTAIAKHDGRTFERNFTVEAGVNRDVEVLAEIGAGRLARSPRRSANERVEPAPEADRLADPADGEQRPGDIGRR